MTKSVLSFLAVEAKRETMQILHCENKSIPVPQGNQFLRVFMPFITGAALHLPCEESAGDNQLAQWKATLWPEILLLTLGTRAGQ